MTLSFDLRKFVTTEKNRHLMAVFLTKMRSRLLARLRNRLNDLENFFMSC